MWYFKSCPRCKGDMFTDLDNFKHCLQCGFIQYPPVDIVRRYTLNRKYNQKSSNLDSLTSSMKQLEKSIS